MDNKGTMKAFEKFLESYERPGLLTKLRTVATNCADKICQLFIKIKNLVTAR